MHEHLEILDLVDKNDKVIGTVKRGEFNHHAYEGSFVRAAEAFIMNDRGELWIPRRTAHKVHAPNGLDFSVSEHVMSGESYEAAVLRGFEEEINLKVELKDLKKLGILDPTDKMPWFAVLFLYRTNSAPQFNPDDFSEAMWITPPELLARLGQGEPAKNGLAPAVRFLMSRLAAE